MLKKTLKQKRKSSPDSLLKTSRKKDIELTEKELGKVTGGRKAGKGQQEFLQIKLSDIS